MKLPSYIRNDLKKALAFADGVSLNDRQLDAYIEQHSARDVVDAWLEWNGIIGFTGQIITLVNETGAK